MAAKARSYFRLPADLNIINAGSDSNSICAVGIIGKSKKGNEIVLDRLLDGSLKRDESTALNPESSSEEEPTIECVFDADRGTLYLHLCSSFSWSESSRQEKKHMQCLSFLFRMCHVILLVFPQQFLDLSYLTLFRRILLNQRSCDQTVMSQLSDQLDSSVWDLWRQEKGRCGVPRLLLVFQQTMPFSRVEEHRYHSREEYRTPRREAASLKGMASHLEEQAHFILSKCDFLTGSSQLFKMTKRGNSYVLSYGTARSCHDPVHLAVNCLREKGSDEQQFSSVKEFFDKHVESVCSNSQLPDYLSWLQVSCVVYGALIKLDSGSATFLSPLDCLSESICKKAYLSALGSFKETLSTRQTDSEKQAKLSQCLNSYRQHSCGPSVSKYQRKLKGEYEKGSTASE